MRPCTRPRKLRVVDHVGATILLDVVILIGADPGTESTGLSCPLSGPADIGGNNGAVSGLNISSNRALTGPECGGHCNGPAGASGPCRAAGSEPARGGQRER